MIKLYGMASPNVIKVTIMLQEAALPYEFTYVNLWESEHFTAEFLSMNPNSKVPVLVDDRAGTPVTVNPSSWPFARAPIARSASTSASIRSVSFRRSSPAP